MKPITARLWRLTAILVFAGALGLFIHEWMFIHPARRLPVTDKNHEEIGEVYVPHDSGDLKLYGFLVGISGLQLGTVLSLTKRKGSCDPS